MNFCKRELSYIRQISTGYLPDIWGKKGYPSRKFFQHFFPLALTLDFAAGNVEPGKLLSLVLPDPLTLSSAFFDVHLGQHSISEGLKGGVSVSRLSIDIC